MSNKIVISEDPINPDDRFSNLQPIINYLQELGNPLEEEKFKPVQRDGGAVFFFKHPIDFDALKERFEFPESISLLRNRNRIICEHTRHEIRGGEVS